MPTVPAISRPREGLSDAQLYQHHENDVALRHLDPVSLSMARMGRAAPLDRNRELTVTRALTLTEAAAASARPVGKLTSSRAERLSDGWPETPPGADPLPGQLDRWLASRGAELVAIRRHIHAHPELSGQE